MKRITIIGNSAAGKSSLAVMLGKELGLPVYHLDKLLWKPGWERTPEDEFVRKHQEIIDNDQLVLDGVAYKSTYEDRFERAEIIIYLDTSVEKCKEHAQKRMYEEKLRPNPYVNENCPYEGDIEDNFKVIRLFHNEYRPLILKQLEKHEKKSIILSDFNVKNENNLTDLISKIKEKSNSNSTNS
ncbi:MAG: hypothetical protein ACTSPK_06585 [Candidatus Heimdallarchaeota archaeon]